MKKYNLIIPILIIFLAIQCSSEMEEDIQEVDTTTATISDSDDNQAIIAVQVIILKLMTHYHSTIKTC